MDKGGLLSLIPTCLQELSTAGALAGAGVSRGKVRDVVDLGQELLIVTTDRISAFDRVLSTIPCKGEILNTLSLFWFANTADIVPNHVVEEVSARTVRVAKCRVVPLEIVVRGYLTGSAWRDYQQGKTVSGIPLPAGMRLNQRFDAPLITPSTKEEKGLHDVPVSKDQILSSGIVSRKTWERMEEVSLALFARGSEIAASRGLILVDTKYELGELDGELYLVDEIHTPDSSRYWFADGYGELFEKGAVQKELDKEYLRRWLMEQGWKGEGTPPRIPDEVRVEVAWKYMTAWQTITSETFVPRGLDEAGESALVAGEIAASVGTSP